MYSVRKFQQLTKFMNTAGELDQCFCSSSNKPTLVFLSFSPTSPLPSMQWDMNNYGCSVGIFDIFLYSAFLIGNMG